MPASHLEFTFEKSLYSVLSKCQHSLQVIVSENQAGTNSMEKNIGKYAIFKYLNFACSLISFLLYFYADGSFRLDSGARFTSQIGFVWLDGGAQN